MKTFKLKYFILYIIFTGLLTGFYINDDDPSNSEYAIWKNNFMQNEIIQINEMQSDDLSKLKNNNVFVTDTMIYANDVGLVSIDEPEEDFLYNDLPIAPKVTISNFGMNNQSSFEVTCVITGPINYTSTKIETLASGSTKSITFDSSFNPTIDGEYFIRVYTVLAFDQNLFNDTLYYWFRPYRFDGGTGRSENCNYWFANSQAQPPKFPSHPSYSWEEDPPCRVTLIENGVNKAPSKFTGSLDDGYFSLSLTELQNACGTDNSKKIKLCGICYDSLFISTNGMIGFTGKPYQMTAGQSWSNWPSPGFGFTNGNFHRPAIQPLWMDLNFTNTSQTGGVNNLSYGITNNQLIITYYKVSLFAQTDYVSFQVCYELVGCSDPDPNIKFTYGDQTNDRTSAGFITKYFNSNSPLRTGYPENLKMYLVGITPQWILPPTYILYRKTNYYGNMAFSTIAGDKPRIKRPLFNSLNQGLSVEFGPENSSLGECLCGPDGSSSCDNGLINNWNITQGLTPGILQPAGNGQANGWMSSLGTPIVYQNTGCYDAGYLHMYGNSISGERISQSGINIRANRNYKISICARISPDPLSEVDYGRIKVQFSNTVPTTFNPPGLITAGIIGGSTVTKPPLQAPGIQTYQWVTYSFDWTAPASYSVLSLIPENDLFYVYDTTSMDVDNICIKETESGICDPNFLTNTLNISTGIDHNTNAPYSDTEYDAFWDLTESPIAGLGMPRPAGVVGGIDQWANQPGSQWLSVYPGWPYQDESTENYIYQTCFCVCGNYRSLDFNLSVMTDDPGEVWLDGVLIPTPPTGFGGPTDCSFSKILDEGMHCLQIHVRNTGGGPTGINVSGSITGNGLMKRPTCQFTGSLMGMKYNDLNANGVKDNNEPGLPGWTIQLNTGQIAVTDALGYYVINDVNPGDHIVTEQNQSGWTQTMPASGGYSVTLGTNQVISNLDFGNWDGQSCMCDSNGILENWNFTEGLVPGILYYGTGLVDNWTTRLGTPRVFADDGSCDPGFIGLSGSMTDGDILSQTGINIRQGHEYKISMSIRVGFSFSFYGRIGVNFSNSIATSFPVYPGGYNGLIVGDNAPTDPPISPPGISNYEWTTYSYIWVADGDYNTINLTATNNDYSPTNMGLDNICIEEITGAHCDSACLTSSLDLSTGFDHSTGSTYPVLSSDNYWQIVTAPPPATTPRQAAVVEYTAGWPEQSGSKWLSLNPSSYPYVPANPEPDPPYIFQTCFCICETSDITFDLSVLTDNGGYVYVDDELIPGPMTSFGVPTNYNFLKTLSPGTHCLQILVRNTGAVMGINVLGSITGNGIMKRSCCNNLGIRTNVNIGMAIEGLYDPILNITRRDSITAYLRNAASPFSIVDSSVSVLDSITFTGNFNFTNPVTGNSYYLVLKHKNSIETWSANPVLINSDSLSYDFTTASNKAFGNNLILKGSKYCIYSGDVNQNGSIDLSDVVLIYNDASSFTTGVTDMNGDGTTDLSDLIIAFNNAANFVHVIKP